MSSLEDDPAGAAPTPVDQSSPASSGCAYKFRIDAAFCKIKLPIKKVKIKGVGVNLIKAGENAFRYPPPTLLKSTYVPSGPGMMRHVTHRLLVPLLFR